MKKFTTLSLVYMFLFINYTNSQTWTNYTTADGLAMNSVAAVGIDAKGNKWFGTIGKGVSKFDGTTWTTYTTANGLLYDNTGPIVIDKQDNKWIGAGIGVSKFDGTNWTNYTKASVGVYLDCIYAIAIDTLGNKWFGTDGGGLIKFDGTTWTTYTTEKDGIPYDGVYGIAIDLQNNIWIISQYCPLIMEPGPNYISKFDGTIWTHYTSEYLFGRDLTSIAIDAQGNKWIGTGGAGWHGSAGVIKFDGTIWTNYTTANGLVSNDVLAIAIDAQGNKWFGTTGGVSKFNGTTWTNYIQPNGWEKNYIYDIAIDAQGNKWFATFGGVSKLSDATTEITTIINENLLNLYPNPVQDVLHINLSAKTGELQVFDISGKCLLQKQIKEIESTVDVSCLENGIYFVRVMHDKQIFTGKIVKY